MTQIALKEIPDGPSGRRIQLNLTEIEARVLLSVMNMGISLVTCDGTYRTVVDIQTKLVDGMQGTGRPRIFPNTQGIKP